MTSLLSKIEVDINETARLVYITVPLPYSAFGGTVRVRGRIEFVFPLSPFPLPSELLVRRRVEVWDLFEYFHKENKEKLEGKILQEILKVGGELYPNFLKSSLEEEGFSIPFDVQMKVEDKKISCHLGILDLHPDLKASIGVFIDGNVSFLFKLFAPQSQPSGEVERVLSFLSFLQKNLGERFDEFTLYFDLNSEKLQEHPSLTSLRQRIKEIVIGMFQPVTSELGNVEYVDKLNISAGAWVSFHPKDKTFLFSGFPDPLWEKLKEFDLKNPQNYILLLQNLLIWHSLRLISLWDDEEGFAALVKFLLTQPQE